MWWYRMIPVFFYPIVCRCIEETGTLATVPKHCDFNAAHCDVTWNCSCQAPLHVIWTFFPLNFHLGSFNLDHMQNSLLYLCSLSERKKQTSDLVCDGQGTQPWQSTIAYSLWFYCFRPGFDANEDLERTGTASHAKLTESQGRYHDMSSFFFQSGICFDVLWLKSPTEFNIFTCHKHFLWLSAISEVYAFRAEQSCTAIAFIFSVSIFL